jgi:hypothetical protein
MYDFGQANVFVPAVLCGDSNGGTNYTCRNRPENYFIFRIQDPIQMDSLQSMFNFIPPGNYILAYTSFTTTYSTAAGFTGAFLSLGASTAGSIDSVPYIFFMKKGDPLSIIEVAGTNSSDSLSLATTISCITTGLPSLKKFPISISTNFNRKALIISGLNEKAEWEIYNSMSQLMLRGTIAEEKSISLSRLAAGIFYLRLIVHGEQWTAPFVME